MLELTGSCLGVLCAAGWCWALQDGAQDKAGALEGLHPAWPGPAVRREVPLGARMAPVPRPWDQAVPQAPQGLRAALRSPQQGWGGRAGVTHGGWPPSPAGRPMWVLPHGWGHPLQTLTLLPPGWAQGPAASPSPGPVPGWAARQPRVAWHGPAAPALCRAVLCRATPCHAMLRRAVPCRATPRCTVLCHATPCHAMPCCTVPCRAMPHRAVPCHATLHRAACSLFSGRDSLARAGPLPCAGTAG